jgi:hypothetical protein
VPCQAWQRDYSFGLLWDVATTGRIWTRGCRCVPVVLSCDSIQIGLQQQVMDDVMGIWWMQRLDGILAVICGRLCSITFLNGINGLLLGCLIPFATE